MNLWEDHLRRRHIVGDWTVVNIIAWSVIMALIGAIACGMVWVVSLLPMGATSGCKV